MTKRQAPGDGSAATRFKRGQSGNPKGRPRKPKPPPSSPFAILDELLTVHEPDGVSELPLEDAMLIKTYQLAITGSRRAQKKIVKMILERHKRRLKSRAPRPPRIKRLIEQDPENALDALEILGIASRRANANAGDSRNGYLRLERWAVEAALRRRNFDELSSSDIQFIREWTHDGDGREMAEELLLTMPEGDDVVGYKRPPRSTRYPAGVSGNPKGRPKRKRQGLPYARILDRIVTIKDGLGARQVTAEEAFLLYLRKKALDGNEAAQERLEEIQAFRREFDPDVGPEDVLTIVSVIVSPDNPNHALLLLKMAVKLYRFQPHAQIKLEPWLVQRALDRLGDRRLNATEQATVVAATRTPGKVRWPDWWET